MKWYSIKYIGDPNEMFDNLSAMVEDDSNEFNRNIAGYIVHLVHIGGKPIILEKKMIEKIGVLNNPLFEVKQANDAKREEFIHSISEGICTTKADDPNILFVYNNRGDLSVMPTSSFAIHVTDLYPHTVLYIFKENCVHLNFKEEKKKIEEIMQEANLIEDYGTSNLESPI